MDDMERMDLIRKLIIQITGDAEAEINPDTRIMDDLEFDSLAVMELLSKIEETFGVDFTDLDDFEERFNRCGDLCAGILELTEKK